MFRTTVASSETVDRSLEDLLGLPSDVQGLNVETAVVGPR
jgi:hypothetical protein